MDRELYDKISQVLTLYEHPEEDAFSRSKEEIADDLYGVLVNVQNKMAEEYGF